MLNDEIQNLSCGHSDEMAAYLYDELKDKAKSEFESHLSVCFVCTDEFAAVSETRFAVYEWRRTEFDSIRTPQISIPYVSKAKPGTAGSGSFSRFLEILAGMPAFAKASLSFAAAAVIAGSVFLNQKTNDTETVQNRNIETLNVSSRKVNPKSSENAELANKPEISKKAAADNPGSFEKNVSPTKAFASNKRDTATKISSKTPVQAVVKTDNLPKKNIEARDTKIIQNAPRLTNSDEAEDDSLRLADLFEEVGAG